MSEAFDRGEFRRAYPGLLAQVDQAIALINDGDEEALASAKEQLIAVIPDLGAISIVALLRGYCQLAENVAAEIEAQGK